MQPIDVVIVSIMLITSAHAGKQNATVQIDTAPIENPPLPRPRPSLHEVNSDNPAVLISAFRHQNGEESVTISSALTRIAHKMATEFTGQWSLGRNKRQCGFCRATRDIQPCADWSGRDQRI